MNRIVSLALLAGGVALIIIGISATNSFSSDVSRFFTGFPTDKAGWMVLGGIVANIAGLTDGGTILDTDHLLFDKMFGSNVRAPFFLMQDAVKLMQRERTEGTIVNILSVNAYIGSPNLAAYSASKGALMTLTKNTANAVNMLRIRVNGIILGWADTPGEHVTLKKFHDASDDWLEKAEVSRPFGKLLKPEDVARIVAFLGGPESAPMTGSCVEFEQTVIGASSGGSIGYPGKKA